MRIWTQMYYEFDSGHENRERNQSEQTIDIVGIYNTWSSV